MDLELQPRESKEVGKAPELDSDLRPPAELEGSLQQTKDLSASRCSLKSNTDYDSSATVSADEGASQLDTDGPSSAVSQGGASSTRLPDRQRTVLELTGGDDANVSLSVGQGQPSFVEDVRSKGFRNQNHVISTSRAEMFFDNVYSGVSASSVQLVKDPCKETTDTLKLEPGEQIIKKTVRDLIDQAIDTSFPNGAPQINAGSGSGSSSVIPNIHDILRRSEKPVAMMKERVREPTEVMPRPLSPLIPSLSRSHPPPGPSTSGGCTPSLGTHIPTPLPPPQHSLPPSQHHRHPSLHPSQYRQDPHPLLPIAPPPFHHPRMSHHHVGTPPGVSSVPPQSVPPPVASASPQPASRHLPQYSPPEPLPTPIVGMYGAEQCKAEDLSMKKGRSVDNGTLNTAVLDYGKATFRQPPPSPVQKPVDSNIRYTGHHVGHPLGDRSIGVPPPAHSNQYSRPPDVPPHLADAHRDSFYHMRQPEPRTKSPSAFVPDRTLPPPHMPQPPAAPGQRASSPLPHVHVTYLPRGRSPPSTSNASSVGSKVGLLKTGGPTGPVVQALPPLPGTPSSNKHPVSQKLSPKPDKLQQVTTVTPTVGGSITHGTPVVNQPGGAASGVPAGLLPLSHANPRYDDILRQLTPQQSTKEGGSITLGTPMPHDTCAQKRRAPPVQEGILPSGQSLQPNQGPCDVVSSGRGVIVSDGIARSGAYDRPPPAVDTYYRQMSPPASYSYTGFPYARPPFATESQISSRQTIMTDYYISQQMQVRRSSGDKDSRLSPRARDPSPQAGIVVDHRFQPLYSYPPQSGLAPPAAAYLHPDSRMVRHPPSPVANLHDIQDLAQAHRSSPGGNGSSSAPLPWSRGPSRSPGMPPHSTPPPTQQRGVIRTAGSGGAGGGGGGVGGGGGGGGGPLPGTTSSKAKPGGGVIIHSPKSSSPRTEVIEAYGSSLAPLKGTPPPPRHSHGQEAFSALVDVAYAQSMPTVSSKELAKHHHPSHYAPTSHLPLGHDPRTVHGGMPRGDDREAPRQSPDKRSAVFLDHQHHLSMTLPPATPEQQRHKFDMGRTSEGVGGPLQEDVTRDRKMRGGPFPGDDQSPFIRPEYNVRMETERERVARYKLPLGQGASQLPPARDGPDPEAMSPHHIATTAFSRMGFHEQRRSPPPPPTDVRRASSSREAYTAYAARGATSFRQQQQQHDPTKLLFDSLEKDQPKESSAVDKSQKVITTGSLIDAIISHHINKPPPTTPPGRKSHDGPGNTPSNILAKPYRRSPESSGSLGSDGDRVSPYRPSRQTISGPSVQKCAIKEEVVVTLDDSPIALDSAVNNRQEREQQATSSVLLCTGPSPTSALGHFAERPNSRGGRISQPSTPGVVQGPLHGGTTNSKLTLKDRIDAIITEDYHQGVTNVDKHLVTMQYNRVADGATVVTSSGGCPSSSQRLFSPHGSSLPTAPDVGDPSGCMQHLGTRVTSPDDQNAAAHQHTYSWKLRRALQQDREQQQHRKSPPPVGSRVRGPGTVSPQQPLPPSRSQGLLAPDERQIIRIAQQPTSPKPSEASSMTPSPLDHHPHHLHHHHLVSGAVQPSQHSHAPSGYQVEPISPPAAPTPDSNVSEASSTTVTGGAGAGSSQHPSSWITSPNITSLLTTRRIYQAPDSSDTASGAAPTHASTGMQRSQQVGLSPFENYVKHKIVEEMRKSSEEATPGEGASGPPQVPPPPSLGSPRDDRLSGGYGSSLVLDRDMQSMGGGYPGPASQYVPGAIYQGHPPHPMLHHPMEPPSVATTTAGPRGCNEPSRMPFKRTPEVMEASGSSEWRDGRPGSTTSRSRSISPSSSDGVIRDGDEAIATKRKRIRLADVGGGLGVGNGMHATPESSTERSRQTLPESSEASVRSGVREPQLSSSSDPQEGRAGVGRVTEGLSSSTSSAASSFGVSGSGLQTSSSSSPQDYPQSTRKESEDDAEAQSSVSLTTSRGGATGGRSSVPWDDEVTSGKEDKVCSEAACHASADSPQSGEMVIDESVDSATPSKLEPVSPPPQEGVSTSERDDVYAGPGGDHATSSSSDPGQSVSSSHGSATDSRGSPSSARSGQGASSYPNAAGISSSSSSTAPTQTSFTGGGGGGGGGGGSGGGVVSSMGGVSTTYAYPFSALSVRSLAATAPGPASPSNVSNAPSSTQSQAQQPSTQARSISLSGSSRSNSPVSASRDEPAPLMLSQYEPLSDED